MPNASNQPLVEQLFSRLIGSGSEAELEAMRQLRDILGPRLPSALLSLYRRSKRFGPRLAAVFYGTRYARWHEDAYRLGLEAIYDKSRTVRFRAYELLAFAQKEEALPVLRAALSQLSGKDDVEDVHACMRALEKKNHNCFRDRKHTGTQLYEFLEVAPDGSERYITAPPCGGEK